MCIRERVDVRPWSPACSATSRASPRSGTRAGAASAQGGAYLCGAFSLADAFYAPVAFRFRTYGVAPDGAAGDYLAALLAHPFLREWEDAALAETAIVDADEPRISTATSSPRAAMSARMSRCRPEWQAARIRAAAAARQPLAIRGGGTKDFYGEAIAGDVLDTTALRRHRRLRSDRARDHGARRDAARRDRARDARGRADARVRAAAFRRRRDAGRLVAAGLSGPRRPYAGAVRDLVLGVRILDGKRRRPLVRRPGDEERRRASTWRG